MNPTPSLHLPNQSLQNRTNHNINENATEKKKKKNAMNNFQELIFKLAESRSLNPSSKTMLQSRLNQFVSEYKTPDHPPYSSMIETVLNELNEEIGSTVESISQQIEKSYDNLPFAHSVLVEHHLVKLVETGEIIMTHDRRYGLPGRIKLLANFNSTKLDTDPASFAGSFATNKEMMYSSQRWKPPTTTSAQWMEAPKDQQKTLESSSNILSKEYFCGSSQRWKWPTTSTSTQLMEAPKDQQKPLEPNPKKLANEYFSGCSQRWKWPTSTSTQCIEASNDQQRTLNSSPISINPRDLRVNPTLEPVSSTHFDSSQQMQLVKRPRGRPPKRGAKNALQ